MNFNPYQPPNPVGPGPMHAQPQPQPQPQSVASARLMEGMRRTKPWVTLFAVLGFISAGFMVLAALGMMVAASEAGVPGFFGLFYLVGAAFYGVPAILLMKYASAIGSFVNLGGLSQLEDAVEAQQKFWQLVGILFLVGIILGVVFAFGMAAFFAAMF